MVGIGVQQVKTALFQLKIFVWSKKKKSNWTLGNLVHVDEQKIYSFFDKTNSIKI